MSPRRVIRLPTDLPVVFVGDTHGSFSYTKWIFRNFKPRKFRLVFLGDAVDRGPASRANVDFLLEWQERLPEHVIYLMGNHEAVKFLSFRPMDFWESLSKSEWTQYANRLAGLPLVVVLDNIIAFHSSPPDVRTVDELETLDFSKEEDLDTVLRILWDDLVENGRFGRSLHDGGLDEERFSSLMSRLGMDLCIRGHNPFTREQIFQRRCLTLMTCERYKFESEPRIALWRNHVEHVGELEILRIPC